eukprot:363275-Chlamydomonas_euryale.AAC.2
MWKARSLALASLMPCPDQGESHAPWFTAVNTFMHSDSDSFMEAVSLHGSASIYCGVRSGSVSIAAFIRVSMTAGGRQQGGRVLHVSGSTGGRVLHVSSSKGGEFCMSVAAGWESFACQRLQGRRVLHVSGSKGGEFCVSAVARGGEFCTSAAAREESFACQWLHGGRVLHVSSSKGE